MKEHNEIQADDIRNVERYLEVGVITNEEAKDRVKQIIERPVRQPIEVNLNWYVEVTLNESGVRIWKNSMNEDRLIGDRVTLPLWEMMMMFGPEILPQFFPPPPICPQFRLFPE